MTTPQFLQNQFDLWKICHFQAHEWTACLGDRAETPKSKPIYWDKDCVEQREKFTRCALDWRESINDPAPYPNKVLSEEEEYFQRIKQHEEQKKLQQRGSASNDSSLNPCKIRIKGQDGRQFPHQCLQLQMENQKCMFRAGFDTNLCKVFMESIKHCCLLLHGQEFIEERNAPPASGFRIRE